MTAPNQCPCCGDPHSYGAGELCDYCWHSGDHDEPAGISAGIFPAEKSRPVVTADIAGGVL